MKTGEKELADLLAKKKAADDLKLREEAAREKATKAAEKYKAAITEHVYELLRGLTWKKFTGCGSRSELEADLPANHELVQIDGNLCNCGLPTYRMHFGPVCFRIYNRGWNSSGKYLRVDKGSLEKIGIKMKRSVNKDRQKMSKLLAKHDVTPEQLEELLKKAKK